mgnify:FL=1
MINIKEFLDSLKGESKLKDYVIDYYKNLDEDSIMTSMEDLQRHGCISGMIPELIYYDDTNEFYDTYKTDINDLLSNLTQGTGLSVEELFKDQFDENDPLIIDCFNKNLMAWFGFEETSYQLYEQLYEKLNNNQYDFEY